MVGPEGQPGEVPADEDGVGGKSIDGLGFGARIAALLLALAAGLVLAHGPALAQAVDCQSLKAEINAGGRAGRAGQFDAALRQQQYELDRTQTYSESIGCNSGFFFGAPPQCSSIEARIQRMQDNIDQLRQQMDSGDGGDRRRAMIEQYNSYCSTDADAGAGRMVPVDPDAAPSEPAPDGEAPATRPVHSKALCVRHCDGGFFPITDEATPDNLDRLGEICKAQCPNAETSLYTVAPSEGIENAVGADGSPYTALPAAFKYQKSYDPACACKGPNQSWVQALADAEKLLDKNTSDVLVTKQISDAMARPVQPGAAPDSAPAAKPAKKTRAARRTKSASPPPVAPPNMADQFGTPPPVDVPDEDVTRQFRRGEPTL